LNEYLVFLLIAFILAVCDYRNLTIPNLIVIPAIAYGIYITGNWVSVICIFLIGTELYRKNRICGGDLKLFMMAGAFTGWLSIPIILSTILFIKLFRKVASFHNVLPVAPFFFINSLFVLLTVTMVTSRM